MEGLELTAGGQALDCYRGHSFVSRRKGFEGSRPTLPLRVLLGAEVHGYALPPPAAPNNFDVHTASWFRAHHDGSAGLRARCLRDIREYLSAGRKL